MSYIPPDRVTATRYAPNGRDKIAWMRMARGCTWMEENSKPGWATFEVPLADAPGFREIVKLTWWHQGNPVAHFGCRVNGESIQHAVDGLTWARFENQPGIMAMIGDGTVYPWQGVAEESETTRHFGYMTVIHAEDPPREMPWYVPGDWTNAVGRAWSATGGGYRNRKPHAFRGADPDAQWISLIDPDASQPPGTNNYFRKAVAVPDDKDFEILYTGDQFVEFFADNRLVASGRHDWWQPYTIRVHFDGGLNRIFAVRVRNAPHAPPDGPNPCAFICTIRGLKPNGDPDGTILLHTDSDWIAHGDTPTPGWSRANVLGHLVGAAKQRGISACDYIRLGFDDAQDSDGQLWTDRGQYAFDVGQVGLSDIATQLCEGFMDVGMDPRTMTMNAYNRRGRDRSAHVQLDVGHNGGNLTSYTTATHAPRFTVLINKVRDGSWIEVSDPDAVAYWGRIERGMNIGATLSEDTATRVAQHQLSESGHARTYVTSESVPDLHPIPYIDYGIGDTISVPRRHGGGYMTARVLAITVDGSGDTIRAWPEYVQDPGDG